MSFLLTLLLCFVFFACQSTSQQSAINTPPQIPNNPSPENGTTGVSTTTTLTWDCVDPEGDQMAFQVFLSKQGEPLKIIANHITENSWRINNLDENCTYNWQIVANDRQDSSERGTSESLIWHFTTKAKNVTDEEHIYYCSKNGDNSNDGSKEKPWETPGFAVRQLHPGDTLIIKEGEYVLSRFPDDILTIPGGTAQKPIIVKGEGWDKTILKGDENLYAMIILDGVSHVTLSDMALTNNDLRWVRDGINGVNESINQITLKNLYIHHLDEFGINFKDVEDLQIDNCTITYCGFGSIGGPSGEIGWKNCTITNSYLSYSGHYYRGLFDNPDLPYSRPDGIGLESSMGPVTIENCIAEHNRGDGIDLKNQNSFISKCIVANNYGDGVKLWGDGTLMENCLIYGTGDGELQSPWCPLVIEQKQEANAQFTIKNCTIHDHPQRHSYSIYSQYNDPTPLKLTIINCTFSDSYGLAYFGKNVDLTILNSNFYAPNRNNQIIYKGVEYTAEELKECSFGENIISVDPQFIHPVWGSNGENYHLKTNSPLIDQGTSVNGPEEDLESTSRPQGSETDIGAYEQ